MRRENGFIIKQYAGANGGAYSATRRMYESIKVTPKNVICSSRKNISEAVFTAENTGGMIIFSTDVNAVNLSPNSLANWCRKKFATVKNRVGYKGKVDAIAQGHNLGGWTIGKFLSGRYTAKNGSVFSENSLSLEIADVTTDELIKIAEELCKAFLQESALVKDYNTGKIYFVSIDGDAMTESYQEPEDRVQETLYSS